MFVYASTYVPEIYMKNNCSILYIYKKFKIGTKWKVRVTNVKWNFKLHSFLYKVSISSIRYSILLIIFVCQIMEIYKKL